MYDWFAVLWRGIWHNIVNQIYFNLKKKKKKKKEERKKKQDSSTYPASFLAPEGTSCRAVSSRACPRPFLRALTAGRTSF